MAGLARLYSLREDSETVAAVQKATLETREFGLEPDPALFGSADWWAAIESGRLPNHEIEGMISKVYWGSMNDWPEFEITAATGETTTWTRLGDHTRYVEGLQVRLSYVDQSFKREVLGSHTTNHVVEVWVEESLVRSSRYAPGPAFTDAPWKDRGYLDRLRGRLEAAGAELEPGLTETEVSQIESEFGFAFPPDLRHVLQTMLPTADRFPDWRNGGQTSLRERLSWPEEGLCFDVEHNDFWLEDWGARPRSLEDALATARDHIRRAPTLIPFYAHRYIPAEPVGDGNPVLSVYQADIIYYGSDLPTYFAAEFGLDPPSWAISKPREIRFWSRLVS